MEEWSLNKHTFERREHGNLKNNSAHQTIGGRKVAQLLLLKFTLYGKEFLMV